MSMIKRSLTRALKREVPKLLWFKKESGWAMLFKGLNMVPSGHGSTMLKVLEDFEKWEGKVANNNLGSAFKEYHDKVAKDSHLCHRFDAKNVIEKGIPYDAIVQCSECSNVMGIYLTFQCCHGHIE
ncbi:hypothetical protein FEM48_Zijuj07G0113800 [Ziziphus jujuba var. spinosa]|uniref:Sieve element occlusion C-terminal domain-containing protein n=1 Tax=Ziziphus jujuba var. spinosa TaxID=714518 RepID=A0A978V4C4_ZIZJJ|nr:hypothetical protein FEM48_Zijuj07G0113800 [Ziziphus jujuba var. spinosa]